MLMKSIIAASLAALLLLSGYAVAEENLLQAVVSPFRQKEVNPVNNKQYKDECGSCHFAYQPGLLTTRSWEKLLTEKALAEKTRIVEVENRSAHKTKIRESRASGASLRRRRSFRRAERFIL